MTKEQVRASKQALHHLCKNSEAGKPVTGADTDWLKDKLCVALSALEEQLQQPAN